MEDDLEFTALTEQDEEFQMLLEVSNEFSKQESGSITQKSGKATQIVIYKHLIKNCVRLSRRLNVRIPKKGNMNLLFLLKNNIDTTKPEYSLEEVDTVLKITNNAVGSPSRTVSKTTRARFKEMKRLNENLRFGVVVLSENLLPPKPYKHSVRQKDFVSLGKVFTLILRKKSAHELYLKETVIKLQKNGELLKPKENGWADLKNYLIEK